MCWSEFVVSQNMGPVIFGVHTTCLILILPWKGTFWIAWRFLQHLCLFWLFAFLLSVNQSSFKRNAACSHILFLSSIDPVIQTYPTVTVYCSFTTLFTLNIFHKTYGGFLTMIFYFTKLLQMSMVLNMFCKNVRPSEVHVVIRGD